MMEEETLQIIIGHLEALKMDIKDVKTELSVEMNAVYAGQEELKREMNASQEELKMEIMLCMPEKRNL
jgi:hypothetical protein